MCIVGEAPGISVGDIAKTIGEMWRGLSDADKKTYQVCVDLRPDTNSKFCIVRCILCLGVMGRQNVLPG